MQGRADEAFELFASALGAVLRKSQDLELLVLKLQRERVGKTSERVDAEQLRLMFEQLCGQGQASQDGATAAPDPEAEEREDSELRKKIEEAKKAQAKSGDDKPRGRKKRVQAVAVERQIHRHELPEAERACAECGETESRIGEDVTHRLEYVPGHFVDHEHHNEKYACAKCREGVTTAPKPDQVIERSSADASVLAHVVVSKFVDHSPLHRTHNIFKRSGVSIPVSTLSDWTGAVADLLEPLVDRLAQRVRGAFVVRTDGTGLKVLDRKSPQNIERGTMWTYVGDDRDVLMRYTPTGEGATGPWEFLQGRTGYIQADAASVFDRLFNGRVASAVEVGCWAHGRRRLVALKDTDPRVAYPLLLIGRLYGIERLADARELSFEERAVLRQQLSVPVLEKIKRWLVPTLSDEPPGSALAKAAAYLFNQWEALSRFTQEGRLNLDNNICEQQLRTIALGRRNYLFCGSHQAARRAAVLYSLTRTCARHGIAPLAYLTDVLRKIAAGWTQNRIEELLPGSWRPAALTHGS